MKRVAPKPRVKRGAFFRLFGAVVGVVAGASVTYWMLSGPRWEDQRDMAAFIGGVVGAALIYIVTGVRIVLTANMQRFRHSSLTGQIESILSKAEKESTSDLERDPHAARAAARLGTAQLLLHEADKSLMSYQRAREAEDAPVEAFNNAGVALVKRGRIMNAIELFEQSASKNKDATAPHANMAHALELIAAEHATLARAEEEAERALAHDHESPAYYNRLGLIRCLDGRIDESEQEFRKALDLAGGNRALQADAYNDLGIVEYSRGNVKAAMANFQQAFRLDGSHGRALANQGVVMVQSGTLIEGIEKLQQAARLDGKSAGIFCNLGYALCKGRFINAGIVALREAISLEPGMYEALYNLGKAYADNGATDHAARYLARALQVAPNSWQTLVSLAVVNIQQEKYMEARQSMEHALRYAPEDKDVLMTMGVCLALTYDYEAGERYLRGALAIDKDSAEIYGQLSWLHIQQREVAAGSEELSVALGMDDKNPLLHDNYGLTQIDLGSTEAAMTSFRRALQLKPDFHRVHYHLGYVFAIRKRLDEAISAWLKSAKFEPTEPDVHANLGVAYYVKERLDDAIPVFRRVLTMRQDRMDDYSNLALCYSKQGVALRKASRKPSDEKARSALEKFGQAVGMFDRAVALAPKNVILHSNRGLACFFANRIEDALQEWTMISRLDPEYARKRGELTQHTVFDESAVNFVEMAAWDRASMMPLRTPDYLYRLSPGYDTEDWDLIIDDPKLATVPALAKQAESIERSLRSLKI